MKPVKQATELKCSKTFSFKVNNKGRAVTFKEGQSFWVTNSSVDQGNRQVMSVARKGTTIGYEFTMDQVSQFFVVDGE